MCSLINYLLKITEIKGILFQFVNIIVLFLFRQKNEESKHLNTNLKKEMFCNFVDSHKQDYDEMNYDEEDAIIKDRMNLAVINIYH